LRYRQSSLALAGAWTDWSCAQAPANAFACRTDCHGAGGIGGRQRSAPIGGIAYGMPRNCRVCSFVVPCTSPSARWISVPFWIFAPAIDGAGIHSARPASASSSAARRRVGESLVIVIVVILLASPTARVRLVVLRREILGLRVVVGPVRGPL